MCKMQGPRKGARGEVWEMAADQVGWLRGLQSRGPLKARLLLGASWEWFRNTKLCQVHLYLLSSAARTAVCGHRCATKTGS